jgi:hypothetical protein
MPRVLRAADRSSHLSFGGARQAMCLRMRAAMPSGVGCSRQRETHGIADARAKRDAPASLMTDRFDAGARPATRRASRRCYVPPFPEVVAHILLG